MRTNHLVLFAILAALICFPFSAVYATSEHKTAGLSGRVRSIDLSKSVPAQLNYQGYLVDATDSSAVTATLEFTFRLFDSETKGAELWSETHTTVQVSNGVFHVLLGSVTPFPANLFDGSPLWLQTEVNTEILTPRKPLVSVAYSHRAGDADQLEGQALMDLDGRWVNQDQSSSVTSDMITDGEITDADLSATAAIDPAKISDGPGSGLDADLLDGMEGAALSDTAHQHDDRYYTEDELNTPGTINDSSNPMDWTKLKSVPATFADGYDDVGDSGGVSQILEGPGIDITNPTGPTTVISADSITSALISDGEIVNADISAGAAIDPTKISGTAWTANNDGAGSGLDADLLDGQQASEFLSTASDYGRSGVATDLYEGTTVLSDKYVHQNDLDHLDAADGDPVQAVYVDDDGQVGIGTTSPTAPLTIQTISGTDVEFSSSGNNADMVAPIQFNIGTSSIHNLHLMTGYLTRMCVTGTGQVGIGTVSPARTLHVAGDVEATTYYGDGSNLTNISATDNDWTISGDDIYHETGNVGMGTASPETSYTLHVERDCHGNEQAAIYAHAYQSSFPTFGSTYAIYGSLDAADVGGAALYGDATSTEGYSEVYGVYGKTDVSDGYGVYGKNTQTGNFGFLGGGIDVYGENINYGAYGQSNTGYGVHGKNATSGKYAYLGGVDWAGYFGGDVHISGDVNTDSLYKIDGNAILSVSGDYSLRVGVYAGANNTGDFSTFLGYRAGFSNQGEGNTSVGFYSGNNNQGIGNTFVGSYSGYNNQGEGNTFVGSWSGDDNNSGDLNAFFGSAAGSHNTTGSYNTFLGERSGRDNTTGNSNLYAGQGAGLQNTGGSYNTFIGWATGFDNILGSSNVFIGNQAGYHETGSGKLYVANGPDTNDVLIYGNFSTGNIGLGTLSPQRRLHIVGVNPRILIEASSSNPEVNFRHSGEPITSNWSLYKEAISGDLRCYQNGDRMTIEKNTGNVGIGTTSPTQKLHVVGDIYCTGKLTSDGGNDPPYVLYNKESRAAIVERVATEVPEDKQSGAVLFWNGEDKRFEVYLPEEGEFRDLQGNLLIEVSELHAEL